MSQQIFDIDTVGCSGTLGEFYDFYVNNTFYLLAPEYYFAFYSIYLNRCLACYDGWVNGFHNRQAGLVPQRLLPAVASGLNNMLFANGIDFTGDLADTNFAIKWAKRTALYRTLKKAHKYAIAGGTSLIKTNRANGELFVSAHRIDTFFADFDSVGDIIRVKVFFDAVHNTVPNKKTAHYGICEERYFNDKGEPCVKITVYRAVGNLQTSVNNRPKEAYGEEVKWAQLPFEVKQHIKTYYPSVVIGEEQYLPFATSLGCRVLRFTDDIPQVPNLPLGQPIGDILFTENFQYDQMKYFEKNEVDLARARALIPEQMWNKDDDQQDYRALSERFYQKVSSIAGDNDKVTPIQFALRGEDIRKQKENIYKDIALKLNISASSVASFLSEGAGARTATEIVSERTKSDTWIKGQIELNAPAIDEMLEEVMRFYGKSPVRIILKAEDQSPANERLKTTSDVFAVGNMSPERFVKENYKTLSEEERSREIKYLEETKALKDQMRTATIASWSQDKGTSTGSL